MRLTVLGKSPAWQDAGGACSSYLVEAPGAAVLLDCGHGAFSKLRRFREPGGVDAVVLSHMHADHISDLVAYAFSLTVAPRAAARPGPRLLVPPGGIETLAALGRALSIEGLLEDAFALEEYDPRRPVTIGPLALAFCPVPHYVPTFAIAVERSRPAARLVYSADTGPSPELAAFARDADLLVIEATLPDPPPEEEARGHLSAREAGEHGRTARAQRVVLTHISDELDRLTARRDGAAGYGGAVEMAREGAVYELATRDEG